MSGPFGKVRAAYDQRKQPDLRYLSVEDVLALYHDLITRRMAELLP
jgi:hypothetical protein